MPELPEVETVRAGLNQLIVDKTIKQIDCKNPKSFQGDDEDVKKYLIGTRIIRVDRRAKVILIRLSSKHTVMVHLKMTGQLVFVDRSDVKKRWGAGHPNDSLVGRLPDRSTRIIIIFSDGSELFFNDQRKFGWIKLLKNEQVKDDLFMKKVGPEPLLKNFTNKIFIQRIRRRNGTSVKAAILDQSVLAGVGNIYADESLWQAKINPTIRVKNLTDKQLKVLHEEIIKILRLSIKKGGSTSRNYVNAEGKKGSYLDFARVFRREKEPCLRCGAIIEKIKVAGRGTHICPVCQPLK